MIRMFIDGPLVGDVRTDFPASLGPTIRIPVPRRTTWCDCDEYDIVQDDGPEIVTYTAISTGERVAVMSCKATDDQAIVLALKGWVQSNLSAEVWERHCRDRRAFT